MTEPDAHASRQRSLLGAAFVVVWLAAGIGGTWALARYALTPARASAVAQQWPPASALRRERSTLLVFAHGRCPCTQASLSELARVLARHCRPTEGAASAAGGHAADAAVDVRVLVHDPLGASDSPVAQRARAIPGVSVVDDPGGRESALFGVTTSGHVLLYDSAGTLLFSGGITPARGHEGDSAGGAALAQLLGGASTATPAASPVFGCSIATCAGGPA